MACCTRKFSRCVRFRLLLLFKPLRTNTTPFPIFLDFIFPSLLRFTCPVFCCPATGLAMKCTNAENATKSYEIRAAFSRRADDRHATPFKQQSTARPVGKHGAPSRQLESVFSPGLACVRTSEGGNVPSLFYVSSIGRGSRITKRLPRFHRARSRQPADRLIPRSPHVNSFETLRGRGEKEKNQCPPDHAAESRRVVELAACRGVEEEDG